VKEVISLLAVNYTELRGNMKECMDKVSDDYETLIITRKKNRNIVMISEETYNNMLENMHLLGNEANYRWLMESKRQLENGQAEVRKLIEVETDE
jgi:antitoxin YefM